MRYYLKRTCLAKVVLFAFLGHESGALKGVLIENNIIYLQISEAFQVGKVAARLQIIL